MSQPLYESIVGEADTGLSGSYAGRVAVGATDMGDRIWVTIDAFADGRRYGPCRWQSRDDTSLPARGDRCLVIFDDNQEGWVTVWWPFNT